MNLLYMYQIRRCNWLGFMFVLMFRHEYLDECMWNRNNKEVFKDLAEIFYKMFTTLAAMVAMKCTNDGEKLLAQNYTLFLCSKLSYNYNILIFPISLLLLLGYAVSFLALTLISGNIALINLVFWVLIFTFVVIFYKYQPSKVLSEKIKQNFERYIEIPLQLRGRFACIDWRMLNYMKKKKARIYYILCAASLVECNWLIKKRRMQLGKFCFIWFSRLFVPPWRKNKWRYLWLRP